jgi:hypothetical protein
MCRAFLAQNAADNGTLMLLLLPLLLLLVLLSSMGRLQQTAASFKGACSSSSH